MVDGMTDQTSVSSDTSSDVDNARTVEILLSRLQVADTDGAAAVLDENVVAEAVGLLTIHGRARTVKVIRAMEGRVGFEVKIHRIAVNGSSVLTERTDVLLIGRLRLQFWVCGVFEVHNGRITLWRDYVDAWDLTKALLRGVIGAAVPALRPTL
jgi:limonene-1,2-epoxide hydrolase